MQEIEESIIIDPEHSIEFGISSWDEYVNAIRRRKNNAGGGYDPFSSSEIPIDSGHLDIDFLVCECLKRDKIGNREAIAIIKEAIKSIIRQLIKRLRRK